jgi:hypothetical protein
MQPIMRCYYIHLEEITIFGLKEGVKGGFLFYCLQGRDIGMYSTKGQSLCPYILGSCDVS